MTRTTSIEAYHKIRDAGLLSKRRFEIYEILVFNGPLTASEIELLIQGDKSPSRGSNVHARLCELREMGVVVERGLTVCPVSHMTVIAFDVTDKLPSKVPKKITTREKIATLTELCKDAAEILRGHGFVEVADSFEKRMAL